MLAPAVAASCRVCPKAVRNAPRFACGLRIAGIGEHVCLPSYRPTVSAQPGRIPSACDFTASAISPAICPRSAGSSDGQRYRRPAAPVRPRPGRHGHPGSRTTAARPPPGEHSRVRRPTSPAIMANSISAARRPACPVGHAYRGQRGDDHPRLLPIMESGHGYFLWNVYPARLELGDQLESGLVAGAHDHLVVSTRLQPSPVEGAERGTQPGVADEACIEQPVAPEGLFVGAIACLEAGMLGVAGHVSDLV